jgi:hypothetical protein
MITSARKASCVNSSFVLVTWLLVTEVHPEHDQWGSEGGSVEK